MKLRTLFLCIACWYSTATIAQDVYQTKDAQGNVIYTDKEPPGGGGRKLTLPPVNVLDPAKQMDLDIQPKADSSSFTYRALEVTSPQDNQTIFIATSNLPIAVKVIPPLNWELEHRLQILLDDQVLTENQQNYVLEDADRGSHVIAARILDKNRQLVIESKPVTVHIQKQFTRP
jgi:hypothetical protein